MSEGLFHTLSNKFKLGYSETFKLLQFCKLARKPDENSEEWMGRLRMSATKCNYKEIDRQLEEQFIHGLNDSDISIEIYEVYEIIREFTKIEDNESITSEQGLAWARKVEAQKEKISHLRKFKRNKDFGRIFIRNKVQSHNGMQPQEQTEYL